MAHQTPTVAEKLAIYKEAQKTVSTNEFGMRCICDALRMAQRRLGYSDKQNFIRFSTYEQTEKHLDNNIQTNFPELVKFKPEGKQFHEKWWTVFENRTNARRIGVLNRIIKELEAKL